jgi:hypothetical protein
MEAGAESDVAESGAALGSEAATASADADPALASAGRVDRCARDLRDMGFLLENTWLG